MMNTKFLNRRAGTRGSSPEKSACPSHHLEWILRRKNPLISLQPGQAQVLKPLDRRATSPVANLTIAALILTWLALVVRWFGSYLYLDRSHGDASYQILPDDSRLDRILRLFALAAFVMAGLMVIWQRHRPRLPGVATLLLTTMLLYCAFWFLVGYEPAEILSDWGSLLQPGSPIIYLLCLGVFAGFDAALWPRIRALSLVFAYGSIILCTYYTIKLNVNGTFAGATPSILHLQAAFWFGLCAMVMAKSSRWSECIPALIPIALCIPMAIISSCRSFTLMSTLALLVCLTIPLRRHIKQRAVRIAALCALTLFIFWLGFGIVAATVPERLEAFEGRLMDDSRSSQYSQFFAQVPVASLFWGLGPKATYSFDYFDHYDYVDNQFLFILFKSGFPVLLGYCAVVIWPGFRLLRCARNQQQWLLGVLMVFWILAALGLSIFHSISITPQNLIVILLAGRAWTLFKERRKPHRHGFASLCRAQWSQPPSG
jgi:hypothetical protein